MYTDIVEVLSVLIASFGAVAGTTVPMIIGAMIMGPLTAWLMKEIRPNSTTKKSKPGFEMLVNNFSAGFLVFGMMLVAFLFSWTSCCELNNISRTRGRCISYC